MPQAIGHLSVVPLWSSERAVIAYQSHPGFSNVSPILQTSPVSSSGS